MNITFLIGNGFDINCGMKCTYREAYEGYIKTQSNSNIIEEFKKRIGGNIDTWADFEVAMASDMVNFKSENDFLICLRDFKKYLDQYLGNEEKKILAQLNNKQIQSTVKEEMNNSLNYFFDGISHNLTGEIVRRVRAEEVKYHAISFNYTSVFDNLFSSVTGNSVSNVIHIHGRLRDDLVIGMDNFEQLPKVPYYISNKGKRAFIKSTFNEEFDKMRVKSAENIIAMSDVICVFGMSLGESDLKWRNLLIQWVENAKNVHLFLYNYECSCLANLTADERLDYGDDAKLKILEYFELESFRIENLMKSIHIPCGKNIFNIGNAIHQGINKAKEEHDLLHESSISKAKRATG